MTPEETASRLTARLAELGYALRPATVGSVPGQVARRRSTHWPTLTSVHMFIGVGVAAPHPGAAGGYTAALLDHACANKGGLPRGLQTGVLATAFLVVPAADAATRQAVAAQSPPKRFAAVSESVLVDASTGAYYTFQGRRIIGGAYKKMFERTVQEVTRGLLSPGGA